MINKNHNRKWTLLKLNHAYSVSLYIRVGIMLTEEYQETDTFIII